MRVVKAVKRLIYDKLSNSTNLTTLLSTPPTGKNASIYYKRAPLDAVYPLVIHDFIPGLPTILVQDIPSEYRLLWLTKAVVQGNDDAAADDISTVMFNVLDALSVTSDGFLIKIIHSEPFDYGEYQGSTPFWHAGDKWTVIAGPI